MKRLIFPMTFLLFSLNISAQKYITKNGYVSFFGHTPMEDIKADNNQVASILDISNGEMVFQINMKSFRFEKKLMEEHFNENYVESDKYPKSVFKGKIKNLSEISFTSPGKYNANVEGDMTIHGVTKSLSASGTIEVTKDAIISKSKFNIKPEDYNITIPKVVRDNIAREMEVTVDINYLPMK